MPVLHVLRLCSVFDGQPASRDGFDAIGGMQNHTAALTDRLDRAGLVQTVVTSRRDGPSGTARVGSGAVVVRTGISTRAFRQLWAPAALRRMLRPGWPPGPPVDVVHVHQGEDLAALPLGWLAARRRRCPLVVTLHCSLRHTVRGGGMRTAMLRRVGGFIEGSLVPRADAVLALTRAVSERLADEGLAPGRLRVIPSGYEPAFFRQRSTDPLAFAGRPRVVYAGRLCEQKDVETLVRAFAGLVSRAHLVLVGDGPQRAAVHRCAGAHGIRHRLHITGAVAHTRVPSFLRHADVFVLPSRYEEMGTAVVEAMAAGLPVVASRVGGIPSLVEDGVTGVLVPPGDAPELAAAIDGLLHDRQRSRRLGAAGRAAVETTHAWPALARQIEEVYRGVAAAADIQPPPVARRSWR